MSTLKSGLRKARILNSMLNIMFRTGTLDVWKTVHRDSLTVLNYHRVSEHSAPDFDTFRPNVSATPEMFAKQMAYIKRHYTVITCEQLISWLHHTADLPPYPALITFDDGYHDNLTQAYPILREYDLPAVIFLTTNYIGKAIPFYWDYAAYCFHHTKKNEVCIRPTEYAAWHDLVSREKALLRWINSLKLLTDEEKDKRVKALPEELAVHVPADAFVGLYLNWDQVREMSQNGIEFGAHTANHPILTRVPLSRAARELADAKQMIETEIKRPVVSLAYPNGQATDFSPAVINLAKKIGFEIAFSLIPGPVRLSKVRENPFDVRRVFLSYLDAMPHFATKLNGLHL